MNLLKKLRKKTDPAQQIQNIQIELQEVKQKFQTTIQVSAQQILLRNEEAYGRTS